MADIKQLLATLATQYKAQMDEAKDDDAKRDVRAEFLEEVRDALPEAYQSIAQAAASGSKADADKKLKRTTEKLATTEAELKEVREKLDEAEKAKPDIAAVTAKADAARKKAEERADAAEQQHTTYVRQQAMDAALRGIERDLIEAGYRPRAAKAAVLLMREDGFIKQNEDGEIELYQLGGHGRVPYPDAKDGDAPWARLVADAKKTADALDLQSSVGRGGGTTRAGGGVSGAPRAAGAGRDDAEGRTVQLKREDGSLEDVEVSGKMLAEKKAFLAGGG